MTHEELKELLGVDELFIVTREQLEANPDPILEKVSSGFSPALIIADGKPDLLMFSWEDYKRRFSLIYSPDEFARMEEEIKRYKEENADDLCDV